MDLPPHFLKIWPDFFYKKTVDCWTRPPVVAATDWKELCICMCICVYLLVCVCICLSDMSLCLSLALSVILCFCMSESLSVWLCAPVCVCVCVCVSVSVCLPFIRSSHHLLIIMAKTSIFPSTQTVSKEHLNFNTWELIRRQLEYNIYSNKK